MTNDQFYRAWLKHFFLELWESFRSKRGTSLLALLFASLNACALSTADVLPVSGAPSFAPSDAVSVVDAVPSNAFELGAVRVQGNNYSSDADCTARVVKEARKLGADSVLFQRRSSGAFIGKGPACEATAYRSKR